MTTLDKECVFTLWEYRQEIWDWADEHNISLEYWGTGIKGDRDMWRIRDEKSRAWFALRWL